MFNQPVFSTWLAQAANLQIRLPIVWQGQQHTLLAATKQWLEANTALKVYWLGADAPPSATMVSQGRNYQLLGTECDVLIINAFSGFAADAVAATSGCVKAGGLWLVLCPEFNIWQQQVNPAHQSLLPYPIDAKQHQGYFIPFWLKQLQQANVIIGHNQQLVQPLQWPILPKITDVSPPFASQDQVKAVQAIQRVLTGHRRRPLVLTADRGRGKSAALGIAAAQLIQHTRQGFIITAPSPQAAAIALQHFQQLTPVSEHNLLRFMAIDELLAQVPTAALVFIDEAAAIPTPILQQLLARYSRLVFATTEHGYEGTGRGFTVRFQQHLTQQCPGWQKLHMQQAIRYQQHDPLEQLIFNSFLLQSTTPQFNAVAEQRYDIKCYSAQDWLKQPEKLQQVFSLLSLAHYQTQVKDLASLLDNPQLSVITLETTDNVLACALLSIEGNITGDLAQQIYYGERRLQGHLLAQSLAFHCAQPELASLALLRVMRIAVQPELQRQQLGSQLLEQIDNYAKQFGMAYVGTSYGVSIDLLKFWQQAGYCPVRLGQTADKASSEYSLLMLKAITTTSEHSQEMALQFRQQLPSLVAEHYPLLPAKLILALAVTKQQQPLTALELEQLWLFSQQKRPYELISHLLLNWFNQHFTSLPEQSALTLAAKLWQQHSWQQISEQYIISGKKEILAGWQRDLVKHTSLFAEHLIGTTK
ncbi:tRNA(Met) cytidine acetyltransferase TmcA [Rheinheimera salexigens]|uniref:tRNA(Met) cytidine acetyltransferase TmcA n=1 Tax=Rheinheimera salexigens TaxID=1628148 RepID=A0A1E7Q277_9GAMM|nr:GNAT family N-acetyltransferase [Rheinheimera salexigens]OEY68282.1 tRNA(Met) cytidine acetyltransferase [Rheinheimera salexigens]